MYISNFKQCLLTMHHEMRKNAKPTHSATWQSIDISKRPEAEMYELRDVFFRSSMPNESLTYYQDAIKPNLPWADQHFTLERVSGKPINPGVTWKDWPYANSAGNFLEPSGIFSHTYAERYWPRQAGFHEEQSDVVHRGIRYEYGDLNDVLNLLKKDPLTRQAYLPIWFPEDTGVAHGKRVPCTLGYHFMMRDEQLHVFYPIRSCDFVRHFRDDLYLTVRLVLWMLQALRLESDFWNDITPGTFTFWAGSLHCFVNDWRQL